MIIIPKILGVNLTIRNLNFLLMFYLKITHKYYTTTLRLLFRI